MKLSNKVYAAGMKSMIDLLLSAISEWESSFGSEIRVEVRASEDAVAAAVGDLKGFAKGIDGGLGALQTKIVDTAYGEGIQTYGLTILPAEHVDSPISKELAAWVIDIVEEQALIEAVPHTVLDNGVLDPIDITPELEAALDACVARAHEHQDLNDKFKAVMYRTLAAELFKDKEHWDDVVAFARSALAKEMA